MNKYDERYDIRLAKKKDIDAIMKFLDEHWRKNHILSRNRELFEYEFLDGDSVNFIIAIDRATSIIEAVAGFLRCSYTAEPEEQDIWGSIWKVNDSTQNMSFLGVELMRRLKYLFPHRYHIGIGINPNTTLPIRKLVFRENIQKMRHFYIINSNIKEFTIAKICNPASLVYENADSLTVKPFHSFEEYREFFSIDNCEMVPQKDDCYIKKRFFQNPIYTYDVLGFFKDGRCGAVMISRVQEYNNSRAIRIVDFLGEYSLLANAGSYLRELMKNIGAEYIDFYNIGIDKAVLRRAGFIERTENDTNIIPNYFGPFVQENIDIWVRCANDNAVFCKGDGDQDRPS